MDFVAVGDGEQVRVRSYLDQSAQLQDGLEAVLTIVNGTLVEHLLSLQTDLEAVRSSLPDLEERLAADIEQLNPSTKSVKVSTTRVRCFYACGAGARR